MPTVDQPRKDPTSEITKILTDDFPQRLYAEQVAKDILKQIILIQSGRTRELRAKMTCSPSEKLQSILTKPTRENQPEKRTETSTYREMKETHYWRQADRYFDRNR